MAQVTDDERERICAALREGKSVGKVAREFGRAKGTVSKICAEAGIDIERSRTEKATQACISYGRIERIALIDRALTKANSLLDLIEKPGGMYNWSMALAVLLDKRRQEDDQSGSRRGWIRQLVEGLACDATT